MKESNITAFAQRHNILIIYLFGSQAEKGDMYLRDETVLPDDFSDLDVAIFFETRPVEYMKTYGLLYKELSEIFDPFALDLVFMSDVSALLQYEIIKGLRIYAKDEKYADDLEEKIMKISGALFFKKKSFDAEIMEAMENGYFEFEYSPPS
jgi:predicted nucleotidyltransferase